MKQLIFNTSSEGRNYNRITPEQHFRGCRGDFFVKVPLTGGEKYNAGECDVIHRRLRDRLREGGKSGVDHSDLFGCFGSGCLYSFNYLFGSLCHEACIVKLFLVERKV